MDPKTVYTVSRLDFYVVIVNSSKYFSSSFNPDSAEEFSSASRSIKPGLLTVGVVSAWTVCFPSS